MKSFKPYQINTTNLGISIANTTRQKVGHAHILQVERKLK